MNTVKEEIVRELARSGSLATATAIGQEGGFALMVRYGASERLLGSKRGAVKLFSSLTTLAMRLRAMGISKFEVNSAAFVPGRVRPPRPDRAEALRATRTKPRQTELLA